MSIKMILATLYKIYYLKDPRDGLVKYVGVTSKNLWERLEWHLKDYNKPTKKGRWINNLKKESLVPEIVLIEEVLYWEEREKYWIQYYGGTQYLLNGHEGGRYK
jgi:Uri superfamily endonuclease